MTQHRLWPTPTGQFTRVPPHDYPRFRSCEICREFFELEPGGDGCRCGLRARNWRHFGWRGGLLRGVFRAAGLCHRLGSRLTRCGVRWAAARRGDVLYD